MAGLDIPTGPAEPLEKHRRNLLAICVAVWIVILGGVGPPDKLTLLNTGLTLRYPEVIFIVGYAMLIWFMRRFVATSGTNRYAEHIAEVAQVLREKIETEAVSCAALGQEVSIENPPKATKGLEIRRNGQRVVFSWKAILLSNNETVQWPGDSSLPLLRSLSIRIKSWVKAMWLRNVFWDFLFPKWFGVATLVIATVALVLSLGWDISLIDIVVGVFSEPNEPAP